MEDCGVCFETVENSLTCGHKIHEECVANSGKSICPICRAKVTLSEENTLLLRKVAERMRLEKVQEEQVEILAQFGMTVEVFNAINELREVVAQQEVIWRNEDNAVFEQISEIIRWYRQLCETRECTVPNTIPISVVAVPPYDGSYRVRAECRCGEICGCPYPTIIYYSRVDGEPVYHDI